MSHSIPGANVLLVGATGTGKTYSIRTLPEAGITPFILFTEPGIRTVSDMGCDKLHYKYLPAATPTWEGMLENARKINRLNFAQLAKLADMDKAKYGQFMEVITSMNNFTCDRCGESFGDVSTWGTDRAIIIDSLSGLNIMAMDLVVGAKPTKSMSDWGVAMDNLERFVNKMTADTQCHFVLTAHLEREQDEVTGGVHLMAATLGRKLAPRMPRFFDDVVQCRKEGENWVWSTSSVLADLKGRNLAISSALPPSFIPLIESWKSAGGIIQPTIGETNDLKPKTA
jgi:hypothetical protein